MKVLKKIEEIGYALVPSNRKDNQFFHVAAIFQRNKILSIGQNSFKTHTKARELGYSGACIHAELSSCLRLGEEDCSNYSMAVLRINRQNKLALSRPCPHCDALIRKLGFKKIYFTNKNGEWEKYLTK